MSHPSRKKTKRQLEEEEAQACWDEVSRPRALPASPLLLRAIPLHPAEQPAPYQHPTSEEPAPCQRGTSAGTAPLNSLNLNLNPEKNKIRAAGPALDQRTTSTLPAPKRMLSVCDLRMLEVLAGLADGDGLTQVVGQRELAQRARVDRKNAHGILRRLNAFVVPELSGQAGTVYRYILPLPEIVALIGAQRRLLGLDRHPGSGEAGKLREARLADIQRQMTEAARGSLDTLSPEVRALFARKVNSE